MDKMPLPEELEKQQLEADALHENFYVRGVAAEKQSPEPVIDRVYSKQELQDSLGKRTLWASPPSERGVDYERLKGANIGGTFPVIDDFREGTGKATSYKTMDLSNQSYIELPDKPQNLNIFESRLKNYIDKLDGFNGRTWQGIEVPSNAVKEKVLCVGIPKGKASEGQMAIMESSKKYAGTKNISLVFEEVP